MASGSYAPKLSDPPKRVLVSGAAG